MPRNCLSVNTTFYPARGRGRGRRQKSSKVYVGPRPSHLPLWSTSSWSSSRTLKCRLDLNFDDILTVTHNKVLIAAGVSAAIGQLSKPFTRVLFYDTTFDIKPIFQAGGFPSTHSSAVVATATCLGLERGFSDSIFGMAVVYAALIMYDAQGVRREVGIHAKTLNKLLLEYQTKSVIDEGNDIINSIPGKSSSTNSESSTALEEPSTFRNEQSTLTRLLESKVRKSQNEKDMTSFENVGIKSEKTPQFPVLKESIGHTEVEVIAGALLGLLVGLIVNAIM
ncbi:uncharacterized protein LOC141600090 [Silene latifolia]|uniref:uncharacterized protein LOC141600090 n=1 Tax=Silene latifolia TaxID=37657 RepID=UPI003D76AEB1